MPCASPSCPRADRYLQDFHDQHGHTPPVVFRPTNKGELVRAIIDAETSNLAIRAIGTDMALSQAGVSRGATILTDGLDRHVTGPVGATGDGSFNTDRLRDLASAGVALSSVLDPAITARGANGLPRMVFIEGGMKIRQLLADLSTMVPPLAVPAMGALSRQSVVGALATGTHGSEIDRQPLADFIRAIWLVGPGGQEWWIERTNRWSASAAILKATIPTLCNDAIVVYDDDVFYSAITGVGRLGVVYAVVLEVEPDYWVQERRRPAGEPWAPMVAALTTSIRDGYESPTGIFTTRVPGGVTFLQIALNPNDSSYCLVMERRRVPGGTRTAIGVPGTDLSAFCRPFLYTPLLPIIDATLRPLLTAIAAGSGAAVAGLIPDPILASLAAIGPTVWVNEQLSWARNIVMTSASLGEMAARILERYPMFTSVLVKILLTEFQTIGDQRSSVSQFKRGRSFEVMDQTDYTMPIDCYRGVGSEYFFNARSMNYLTFINGLFASAAALGGIPGYISLRFTPQTDAYLGMERWPMTVAIEISSINPWAAAVPYMIAAQTSAIALGGIPHWGQWLNEPVPTRTMYGTSLDPFHLAVATVQDGRATRFGTLFSAAQSLDPPAAPLTTIRATARPRVSTRAILVAARSLMALAPGAPGPTSIRAVGRLYKPSLRMNAARDQLPAGRAAVSIPGVRIRDLARRLL